MCAVDAPRDIDIKNSVGRHCFEVLLLLGREVVHTSSGERVDLRRVVARVPLGGVLRPVVVVLVGVLHDHDVARVHAPVVGLKQRLDAQKHSPGEEKPKDS